MIFLVRSHLPVVCFPFAACLPWSASVTDSIPKLLELHLGPLWSCCSLQAPVRAEVGAAGEGLAGPPRAGAESPRAALGQAGQPPHPAAPPRGAALGARSGWLGDLLLWGNSQCWSHGMLCWNLRLLYNSACCWTVQWQNASRELLSKVHLIFLKSVRCSGYIQRKDLRHGNRTHCSTSLPVATTRVPCTRARADPPKGALTASPVFYLLLICLANNGCGALVFYF